MSRPPERDSERLHDALARSGDTIEVALSRETLEFALRMVDARDQGKQVIIVGEDGEVSPSGAALLLGMSRPQVRKLIDRGLLESRKVGTHHRITLESIREFNETEKQRSRAAMADLAALQNELGLTE